MYVEAESPYTGRRITIGKIKPNSRGYLPILRSKDNLSYRTVRGTVSVSDCKAAVQLLVLQWLQREAEKGRLSPVLRAQSQAGMLLSAKLLG